MRWLAVLLIWSAAGMATLMFAAGTHLGPTLAVLEDGLHGIHLTDLLFLGVAVAWATATTRGALRQGRRRRR